ncbi:LSU ribosomal protein L10p (P0) [hydrothermal vent metagenome]|uniref:LSU ribosomal protein L10p (P0) n=1 Tax=hydrothermal vent metagenome TaxID=652676 RepID=A0A1W1C0P1_9ZZZZ
MALNLEAKKAIVDQVNKIASVSIAAGVAQYRGLTVEQMTELRASALKEGVHLQVVKNTLAKRAINDTDVACISDVLTGPVIVGFSEEDPGAVARVFYDFSKENETLVVTGLAVSGNFVEPAQLKTIAELPTKDQAISLMMALMLAPVEKLARTLNEVPTKVTRVISAVKETK